MPARLIELLGAVVAERDPAVRGRVAAQLMRDLAEATARSRDILCAALDELAAAGTSHGEAAALLDLPHAEIRHLTPLAGGQSGSGQSPER